MSSRNEEVAGLLREYAELTQITGGDVFRARNYEKAARSVRGWADDVSPLDAKGLRAIPGVGASIAAKIAEYLATGHIVALDELRAKIPPGVLELTRVPGLGPKRAMQLSHDLGVASVDELAAAIKAGGWRLAGFGRAGRVRLAAADDSAPLMAAFTAPARGRRGHRQRPDAPLSRGDDPPATPPRPPSVPRPACRSTCAWCRSTPGARHCSTSPARRHTTSPSGRSPSGRNSNCPNTDYSITRRGS